MVTEISTLQELQDINNNVSGDYVLTSDIDASDTQNWNKLNWCGTWESDTTYNENDYIEESGNYYYQLQDSYTSGSSFDSSQWIETTTITGGSEDDGTPLGWRPLGDLYEGYLGYFEGTFDGQGHTVSDIYINRGKESMTGLFGGSRPDGEIRNVGVVDADINVEGGGQRFEGYGILIGYNAYSSKVENCFTSGYINGETKHIGGLVGINYEEAVIENSYSTGNVSGNERVGGLVGNNRDSATVSNSYATGTVSGDKRVGGLVGINWDSEVSNSYSTGDVSGNNYVGSLVGRIWNEDGDTDEILYSYANSDINPDLDLIGSTIIDGTLDTTGSSLKTTAEMTDYPDYPDAYEGWTFTDA